MLGRFVFAGAVLLSFAASAVADEPYERERELRERERERAYERERARDRSIEREHRYLTGRVVSIDDGDSCTILGRDGVRHRIYLYGVDAPERGQARWDAAKEALARRILQKEVRYLPVETDRDGRKCCRLYLGNREIGLDLVREGYGWHHTDRERLKEYAEAEREAREHHRGIWIDRHPVEPWTYRRELREREAARRQREARRESLREERDLD